MRETSPKTLKRRRSVVMLAVFIALLVVGLKPDFAKDKDSQVVPATSNVLSDQSGNQELASDVLERIPIKGRAPKTGY